MDCGVLGSVFFTTRRRVGLWSHSMCTPDFAREKRSGHTNCELSGESFGEIQG